MNQPRALALSPHLDDAAFSCGGTLARLSRCGWRVTIATLFTASVPDPKGFALACQLDKGLGPEVDYMAMRRDEDATACAALGTEPVWLPFEEAPHRGYASAPELFGPTREDDGIVPRLAAVVRDLIGRLAPALVLAPQAIGGHVDHVQLVRALDEARPAVPVAWWQDFPYLVRDIARTQPFSDRFGALPERSVMLDPADLAAKRAACLAYPSQLGFQFGGPDGLDARLGQAGPVERFRGASVP